MVQLSKYAKAAFPGVAALALVWGVINWWTLGFEAFTSYSHVVVSAAPMPKSPPALQLTDSSQHTWVLSQLRGRYYLMTFGYLSCGGTCPITMGEFQQISDQLQAQGTDNLTLLTITLDPQGDLPGRLSFVWDNYGKPKNWLLATPGKNTNRAAYWATLRNMGMWVDQDRDGNPIHDNRTFLLNPKGLLIRSFAGTPPLKTLLSALLEDQT